MGKFSAGLNAILGATGHGNGVIRGLGADRLGGLGSGAESGGSGGGGGGRGERALARGSEMGAAVGLREEAVAGDGEGADNEDAAEPDHDGDEDGDGLEQGGAIDDLVAEGLVGEDGDGDAPPGEDGVHGGSQEPGAEEIPDFGRLVVALFGGEEASDAGEVDGAEGDGEDGGPGEAGEGETAEQVLEGEVSGGKVEELKRQQGENDDGPPHQPTAQMKILHHAI
jgi:hypothetical protein